MKTEMSAKAVIHRTVARKFQEFCKHCTLHGVVYLMDGSRWWVHGLWALIITGSLFLCCYLGHMIFDKFLIDPTLTVVETTHYSTAGVQFPAVTVCDTDAVYGPNTDNITQLLSLRGFSGAQISDFFKSFSELKLKDYAPKSYVKKMHYLLEDLGYPLSALLMMLKKPCSELVVECSWRSQIHNCSEMFRPVYTMLGHCCQFDIPYWSQVNEQTNFVSGVQETEALEMLVDGHKISADGERRNGNALMYVFDEQDNITFMNNAVTLTPAAYFDVNVYLWAIDSSPYVKALDLNKRRCIVDTDEGATSFQGCMTRAIMRKVVEECNCLPFDFKGKYQASIRLISEETECFQKCDYVQYSTEVEYIKNHNSYSGLASYQSKVAVHFTETTCMKYRREVLYTWDQMLANLGGIFGLCLGGSIISLVELLWFILDLTFTITNTIITQNKTEEAKKNKIPSKKLNANKVYVLNQKHIDKVGNKKGSDMVRFKYTN